MRLPEEATRALQCDTDTTMCSLGRSSGGADMQKHMLMHTIGHVDIRMQLQERSWICPYIVLVRSG